MDWKAEILALHQDFEAWFRSEEGASLTPIESALDPSLTYLGPDGDRLDRTSLMETLETMHGAMPGIQIEVAEASELHHLDELRVVTYTETHRWRGETSTRLSTAILRSDPSAPRGLVWLHVHETWLDR